MIYNITLQEARGQLRQMSGIIDITFLTLFFHLVEIDLYSWGGWKYNMYLTMRTFVVENEEDRKTDFLLKVILLTTDSQLLLSIAG